MKSLKEQAAIGHLLLLGMIVSFLFILCACAANPVADAQTPEQKAFALYGTFVVFEEEGAKLVASTEIPDTAKQAIRVADAKAKPVADNLYQAAQTVVEIKNQLSGKDANTDLATANANLLNWYSQLQPLYTNLVTAVKGH